MWRQRLALIVVFLAVTACTGDDAEEPAAAKPGWKRVLYEEILFDVPTWWAVTNFDQTRAPCGPPIRLTGVVLVRGQDPGAISCPASFPDEDPPPVVLVASFEGAAFDADAQEWVRIGDSEAFLRVDGPGYAAAVLPDLDVSLSFSYVDPAVRDEILSSVLVSGE